MKCDQKLSMEIREMQPISSASTPAPCAGACANSESRGPLAARWMLCGLRCRVGALLNPQQIPGEVDAVLRLRTPAVRAFVVGPLL